MKSEYYLSYALSTSGFLNVENGSVVGHCGGRVSG